MIICKGFDRNQIITSVEEWYEKCPPARKKEHWKDGRSAKELAKDWVVDKGKNLERLLSLTPEFSEIKFEIASPEFETKFDNYKGSGRHHDLLILASQNDKPILISIEAKADETFGNIIKDYYLQSIIARINGKETYIPDRIENLMKTVFEDNLSTRVFSLRYQLLHSVAAIIAEARRRKIKKAIFVIDTYLSEDEKLFSVSKHQNNMKDLNRFVKYLSNNTIDGIENNELLNLVSIKDVDLYVMKREKKI